MSRNRRLFLVRVVDDVEPYCYGPYKDQEHRDDQAKQMRASDPEKRNGIFPLDVSDSVVSITTYSGAFFNE